MCASPDLMAASNPVHIDKLPAEKKKRRRRARKSESSDSGSASSGKRGQNKKKNKKLPQEPELTEEEKARYVALDCEMVGVGYAARKSALARVCLIGWDGHVLLDVYVSPDRPVTDYRTFVSGITQEHLLSSEALTMDECRVRVQAMLEGKVLVGHALKNDLYALGITHPWYDTRDTGKYEPFMKVRFDDGVLWPRKLKDLAKLKLQRDIQQPGEAHSPFEDAQTAMDLYKLVRRKWEKAMDYKINKTREIESRKQQ